MQMEEVITLALMTSEMYHSFFRELDIPTLYADTVRTNTRSQHVLEKVGFRFAREDEEFKYYKIERNS